MRKIFLYIIILIVVFSGYQEIKSIWQENGESLDETYQEVKGGIFSWYQKATDTSKELKESLNEKISTATEKYENLKQEVDSITGKVTEKRDQLEQTLKEIEEAKKALDELLEREGDQPAEDSAQADSTTVSAEVSGEATAQ